MAEKKYHQKSFATIVQDKIRGDILLKANEISTTNVLLFPISVSGPTIKEKSDFIQKLFGINKDIKVVLYFGALFRSRFVREVINLSDELNEGFAVVLHGFTRKAKEQKKIVHTANKHNNVFVSLNMLPENDIYRLISSANIGLALYRTTNANENHVAFSSAKLAYYTQCGIPIIAFETESFSTLMGKYRCGELINSIDEIPEKIKQISQNYDFYQKNSFLAYEEFYNYEKNFSSFLKEYTEIITNYYCKGFGNNPKKNADQYGK
jgi:glycosyltransferase involved in cell wall biosynthesis